MLAGAPSDMVPGGDSSERRRCDGRLRRLERGTSGVAGAISSAMVLSIARSIVQAHGGSLVLANHPEGGLEARITLPA